MNELDKIISDIIKTKPSIVDEFSIWVIIYEHINIKINYSKNVWINGEHVGFVSENIFNEMIDYNEYFKKNSINILKQKYIHTTRKSKLERVLRDDD